MKSKLILLIGISASFLYVMALPFRAQWRENQRRHSSPYVSSSPSSSNLPIDPPQSERPLRRPKPDQMQKLFPRGALKVLKEAQSIELFSVEPFEDAEKSPGLFHGHKVLGRTHIRNVAERRALLASLYDGFVPPNNAIKQLPYSCFEPCHGVRVTTHGKVVDLLVCFSCHQIEVFLGNERVQYTFISDAPRPTFDKTLKQANVPLYP